MRVAVVNWSSRRVGGAEEYVSILLPALRRAGIDVAFWHERDEPKDRPRISGTEDLLDICAAGMGIDDAIEALAGWKPDVLYVQALADLEVEERLLELAPAVFFAHNYAGMCISGGKTWTRPAPIPCHRRLGAPCLLHYFPHGCGGSSPVTMWRLYRKESHRLRLLQRYQAVLTHTDHMHRELARHGLGSRVVPYPIEARAGEGTRLGDGTWRLLFAARMDRLKGGHLLIDAMPAVKAFARRPVRLVMAGDGLERSRWEARARAVEQTTPGLTVEFPGWLSPYDLGTLMENSDLLVVPSVWPEPLGAVGPGAALHGLPAAAFAVGGIPQWLIDGVTGHLAPGDLPSAAGLARAILRCLEDPLHYSALRQGALEMARSFTMARHLPELIATFERISPRAPARAAL
ncbi:MAG TPA: glycosyltransferase family 4 protein [Vicinamibacterales bacterium]|jgi:glycosyltransferase involved in cell wall biosynthesis|nr:glycosyltransferase family 4 protein [Vicinamibacterales bacterium]